mmetsp:Transcript_4234/g.6525  ORF Transcript_4234/g.6525 Transcript_4234/m.6525 type:complete len:109 (+) Transcript_4234:682-1008(+)
MASSQPRISVNGMETGSEGSGSSALPVVALVVCQRWYVSDSTLAVKSQFEWGELALPSVPSRNPSSANVILSQHSSTNAMNSLSLSSKVYICGLATSDALSGTPDVVF